VPVQRLMIVAEAEIAGHWVAAEIMRVDRGGAASQQDLRNAQIAGALERQADRVRKLLGAVAVIAGRRRGSGPGRRR
jgi:hypothetical protein